MNSETHKNLNYNVYQPILVRQLESRLLITILLFLLSLGNITTTFAQIAVIINEEDEKKYSSSPFVEATIKPNAFKDGAYTFYIDSSKTIPVFEGNIVNGKTEGLYYTYKKDHNGEAIQKTKRSIKTTNGNLDGICNIDDVWDEVSSTKKYLFYFDKGELKNFKIINPFFRFFYETRDTINPIDTLTFSFQNGKLESINFYNYNDFYNIIPSMKSNLLDDTVGIKKLSPSEKFYIHNFEYKDSLLVMNYKRFEFNDTATAWTKALELQYDSLEAFNRIVVLSGYPTITHPFNDNFEEFTAFSLTLVEMEFDKNKCLRYIKCEHSFEKSLVGYGDNLDNTEERLLFGQAQLYFLHGGFLDITKK